MTRIERIAPFIEALSDEEFDELLSAATYAAGDVTVYQLLPDAEKAEIADAINRVDSGLGIPYADVKARLKAKLSSIDR
jgi:hypothetical protein